MMNAPGEMFRVFATRDTDLSSAHILCDTVPFRSGAFSPPLWQNLLILLRLLPPDPDADIYHFFFAPNPRTSRMARFITGRKGKLSVQNVSSSPRSYEGVSRLIFGDRVVVHSDYNLRRLRESGVERVSRIYPGIVVRPDLPPGRREAARKMLGVGGEERLILYPGDYGFSGAVDTILEAIPSVARESDDAVFVLACRIKVPGDRDIQSQLVARLGREGLLGRVRIVNETSDFAGLVAACHMAIFPVASLYAKMDIPLALLECLDAGLPIVLSDVAPVNEVMKRRAGHLIPPAGEGSGELAEAVLRLLADDSERGRMSGEARIIVREHFDIRNLAREYEALYRELRGEQS